MEIETKSETELRNAVAAILPAKDLVHSTLRTIRSDLETHFSLVAGSLDAQKDVIDNIVLEIVVAGAAPHGDSEEEQLGDERIGASKSVYLVTFPHPRQSHAQDGTPLRAPGGYTKQEILSALVASVRHTDQARCSPLPALLMVLFREKHADEHVHDHVAIKAGRCFRFVPIKSQLLRVYGLASHWSCTHDFYGSAVAYGYVPSRKKPIAELDPQPLVWAAEGAHPPLEEASRLPVTAQALAKRREHKRLSKAEKGKAEPRFKELDMWAVVVRENVLDLPEAPEQLMAYAKRCGGPSMVEFCFNNWDRLPALISRCWKVEKVEEFVEQQGKSRVEILKAALGLPCVCAGKWTQCANELLAKNNIEKSEWANAVLHSLEHGRSKGTLVCHAGLHGNEGKSFMFDPLPVVFGSDNVFTLTSKSGFPLMNLERCKLTVLDDWRFNEDLIGYPLQLLWFEGKPLIIARPQNQHLGHLKYNNKDPIFITTLESDITSVKGKRLEEGDIHMMLKRLRIFRFHHTVEKPSEVPACATCFAQFLLGSGTPRVNTCDKRHACAGFTGDTPDAKRRNPYEWSVQEVVQYVEQLELGHVKDKFTENAVDGAMLLQLSEDDLQHELGLTKIQSHKIKTRLA